MLNGSSRHSTDARPNEIIRRALGTDPDFEFDAVTAAAARLLACSMAAVSLVDDACLWFKSGVGHHLGSVAINDSLCSHVIKAREPLVVDDLSAHPVLRRNPFVCPEDGVRFYAGVPLIVRLRPDGDPVPVGSFCVFDHQARTFDEEQLAMLTGLAAVVRSLIEARVSAATAADHAAQLEAALALSDRLRRQFHQAERIATIGWWRLALADGQVEWSDQIYAIHDLPTGTPVLLDQALRFFPPADRMVLERSVEQAVATGLSYDVEVDFVSAEGQGKRVRAMGEVEWCDGVAVALFGVFQDVTQRYRLEQALEYRANTDELTRIASRGHFNRVLDGEAARARADRTPLALVLIDLDRFKDTNDRFGHAAGDEVLQRAARVLQSDWLEGSFAARLGGDEFVLLLTAPRLTGDIAQVLARLLRELEQVVGEGLADDPVTVTATLGACLLAAGSECRKRLLERADQALYTAKRYRRGTAAIAGEPGVILSDGQASSPGLRLVG